MNCLCIWKLSSYGLHHLQIFSPQSVGCLLVFVYDFFGLGLIFLFLVIKAYCLPKVKVNYLFWEWENEVIQSCLTLQSPMNCLPTPSSPPGSSIHGIFQARILEWVTISFSKGSSGPRDGTHCRQTLPHSRQTLYHLSHQGTHQGLPSSWGRKESGTTFTDISINPRCISPIFPYFHLLQLAFCLRPSLVTHLP